jgi:transposase
MYQHYLGVDLHPRRSDVVLMDAGGKVIDNRRLPNDAMPDYVAQLHESTFAVLEATGNWSSMYDVLDEGTEKVVLAHPKRVKAIAVARIKTDKMDANILDQLARADLLPTAYAPPVEIRELRDLVRYHSKLVRERTRHKNRIHTVLSKYNLHSPCTDLFGKKGRAFLEKIRYQLSATHQLMLDNYLCMIDALNEHIKSVNQVIQAWAKDDPRMKLLTSMPGVGIYSAAVIIAEIGEIRRFVGSKQLCSCAGLVPSTRSSDADVRHGGITKEGSPWLRWILVSAAQRAPCASPQLAHFHKRTLKRHGKKTARVALARQLLTIIYYMLLRNTPYQERQQG